MTSGSHPSKIKIVNTECRQTGNIIEGLNATLILLEDEQRSSLAPEPGGPVLTLARSSTLRIYSLLYILPGSGFLEESHGLLGLQVGLDVIRDDQGDFINTLDSMSFGHDKSGNGSSSDGRRQSKPLLFLSDKPVPSPPDLGGGEHTTSTAHVTESTLAGPVGTTSTDTRNTSNGTTSSPGLGAGIVTGILVDSIGLTLVQSHLLMGLANDVRSNWTLEDTGKLDGGLGFLIILIVNGYQRADSQKRRHLVS